MSGPSGERCGYCYYCVDPAATDEYYGICRRYPRAPAEPHDSTQVAPWVSLLDWCGEFKLHPNMGHRMWKQKVGRHYDEDLQP